MRLLTGDELGLLKETIPELCRRPPTDSSGHPFSTPWQHVASLPKRPRPSATSIQAAANYNGSSGGGSTNNYNNAVTRIENDEGMTRDRGVVSLSFLRSSKDKDTTRFHFAALRMDGTVEKWEGCRDTATTTNAKNGEGNVTPARYSKIASTTVWDNEQLLDRVDVETQENSTGANSSCGWYTHPPIQPIGMVSTLLNNQTSILATADSSGNISILNEDCKVLSNYHAYETKDGAVLTYTKGGFANHHAVSCIGCGGDRLAVGGRERGVRVLDLETGKEIWKVSPNIICFVAYF